MLISERINSIKSDIPDSVKLVAVSKTQPNSIVMEAYNAGQRIFGENKVQDLTQKHDALPKDIEWHFIGHLQKNKVKYIAPFVSLIHGVDSLKLLSVINKEGLKSGRNIPCLLQVKIAKEDSKFGMDETELEQLLLSDDFKSFENITVRGLMGMATYADDVSIIRGEFQKLNTIFKRIRNENFSDDENFSELSMGMSGDYRIAIEEGATLVRIGSSIFGERNYSKQ